jgi:chloramphenicol-sensitive protein RarD
MSAVSGAESANNLKSGLGYGILCYAMWGAFPLYFKLLESVPSLIVVANRVIWSLVFVALIVVIRRHWVHIRTQLSRRKFAWSALAGLLLVCNWSVYVYAIMNDHVVDASLGYFINPLVTVILAVVILNESLSKTKWLSVALAFAGVVAITFSIGALPWIGVALALSFASYGLIRKVANIGSLEGLMLESASMFPIAIAYLLVTDGFTKTTNMGWEIVALLALAGPVTILPLLAFASAANRLPLSVVGMLQYITPTIIFVLGITLYQDELAAGEWLGFIAIWVALGIFSINVLRNQKTPQKNTSIDPEAISSSADLS